MVTVNGIDLTRQSLEVLKTLMMLDADDDPVGSSEVRDQLGLQYTSQTSRTFDQLEEAGLIETEIVSQQGSVIGERYARLLPEGETILEEYDVRIHKGDPQVSIEQRIKRLERQMERAREKIFEITRTQKSLQKKIE